jgi:hypothetical protein
VGSLVVNVKVSELIVSAPSPGPVLGSKAAVGATVSTVQLYVLGSPVLPTALVAETVKVCAPSPSPLNVLEPV